MTLVYAKIINLCGAHIDIAPAEGQKPIFTDDDTEYLCFPTII